MSKSYVMLTGGKNNAGDFLIKHRAKKLFENIRSDRNVIDMNAWEKVDAEKLDIINASEALILMGGPALQHHMYPSIYKLPENLDAIKVPILMMGIGWKSVNGDWSNTYDYPLSNSTIKLLDRMKADGFLSSVRDFHTLNSLEFKGYDNVLMTGCPAYYDLDSIGSSFVYPQKIQKVAFSLGVSFLRSPSMKILMQNQILELKERYLDKEFEVVFHHSLNQEKFLKTDGATRHHLDGHNQFAKWLEQQGISYIDISGSAENLINYYSGIDLHIGYRVHAHIFMNSLRKLSLLISEDGRAKGSRSVINGMVVDGYSSFKNDLISKVLNRLLPEFDRYRANEHSLAEMSQFLSYEALTNGHRSTQASSLIDSNFKIMQNFLKQLP